MMTLEEYLEEVEIIRISRVLNEELLDIQIKDEDYEEAQLTKEHLNKLDKELKDLRENTEVSFS